MTIGATEASGTGTFTLAPTDDGVAEGPETVLVTGAAEEPGLTVIPAELTITDNDVAATGITLTVDPATVSEGAGEEEVAVTATLDGAARTEATVVTVSVAGGSAAAADFAPVPSFELTIGATEASGTGTFTLAPTDDGVAEGPETVLVTGAAPEEPGLTVTPAELTIVDNDAAATGITLALDPATVPGGRRRDGSVGDGDAGRDGADRCDGGDGLGGGGERRRGRLRPGAFVRADDRGHGGIGDGNVHADADR